MNLFSRYQSVFIALGLIAVLYVGYEFFLAPSDEPALSVSAVQGTNASDQELVSLLLELKAITLTDAIFSDEVFQSLQDFSKDLVSEPVGRPNPFAPLGAAAATR